MRQKQAESALITLTERPIQTSAKAQKQIPYIYSYIRYRDIDAEASISI